MFLERSIRGSNKALAAPRCIGYQFPLFFLHLSTLMNMFTRKSDRLTVVGFLHACYVQHGFVQENVVVLSNTVLWNLKICVSC